MSEPSIVQSLDNFPKSVQSFIFLLEYSPEQKKLSGINITSLTPLIRERLLKTLSQLIHQFRTTSLGEADFNIAYDFLIISPFSYIVYFFRNVVSIDPTLTQFAINPELNKFFEWLLDTKADQVFLTRLLYFIRHWQTVSFFENLDQITELLKFAKHNNVTPFFS
ncbi:hypothetical protein [Acinetobacter sp. Marseille-Q1618]|uniref:hypothetical protein n=1 Tax=Acinetobacter sp. Marseille-Q1618 TaxID=2697502 RepID=UPI00156FFC6B|nr:hypothetical protein [Acinetobacter sp. Marseille-Q1618]